MDKEMFLQIWGFEMRRVREAAGLSQKELAKALQTTQKQISRVENGGNMTLETVFAWHTACQAALPVFEEARD